eukprot:scaffold3747_cov240-Pinguiococcus_pyrenoidosus.AAC.13
MGTNAAVMVARKQLPQPTKRLQGALQRGLIFRTWLHELLWEGPPPFFLDPSGGRRYGFLETG